MERYNTVLYGTIWYSMVRYGKIWNDMIWYYIVRYGMVWYLWYDMVFYGTIWYNMVRYGTYTSHEHNWQLPGVNRMTHTHTNTLVTRPVLSQSKLRDQSIGRYRSCYVQQPPSILNRRLFATASGISKNILISNFRFQYFKILTDGAFVQQ